MKVLKVTLWICGISCLLGFIVAVLPWQVITDLYHWVGIKPPAEEPTAVLIFRLLLAMFGLIGIFFVILARNPLKYGTMLLLAAYGLLCFAFFCLAVGLRYGMPVWAYSCDVIFFVAAGVLILVFRKKAMRTSSA